ncbi:MAG: class IV aminotransferase [Brevundimonas sp.]|uniref:aminotransferase class IV n=1 Tax=Brevundimonas sp. TaxID=1871086 RepID=UPI0011FC3569|nr:aminotransferase class IV [Brevundimonas sp.]RZJ16357.1 MAG: class IV aminotransferase [Brevundimonas sp.]
MAVAPSLWVDGRPASLEDLAHQALVNYGAFTSFRVEAGGVRGLDLHLARLEAEARAVFGEAVSETALRNSIRTALAGRPDAWLRISLFAPEISNRDPRWVGRPRVMVGVFDSPASLAGGVRVQSQLYEREVAELKHVATFGLLRARRAAGQAGFDDALFVDRDGRISEGTLWNVGFVQGDAIVWPLASMLDGVAQRLIRAGLAAASVPQRTEAVRLPDLIHFDGAFLCNSATPAAEIADIDGHGFSGATAMIGQVAQAWRSQPCQTI